MRSRNRQKRELPGRAGLPRSQARRREVLAKLASKHGAAGAVKKLTTLAKRKPELAADIWDDTQWLVRNPNRWGRKRARKNPIGRVSKKRYNSRHRNPVDITADDVVLDSLLEEPSTRPVRSFPRSRTRSRRMRQNPSDWNPEKFDPFKDKHPFGKQPRFKRNPDNHGFSVRKVRYKRRKQRW